MKLHFVAPLFSAVGTAVGTLSESAEEPLMNADQPSALVRDPEIQGGVPVFRGTRIPVAVMLGKPVIRGTRIPVELLLRRMADGATEADLLDSYPTLTRDDIRAAVSFAADEVAHTETRELPVRT